MGITFTVGTKQDIDASTTHTQSFDAGAGAKAIVVAVSSANFFDSNGPVTYGGKTLTKWAEGAWSTGGHQRGEIWGYEGSDIPTGANTLSFTTTSASQRMMCAYGVTASGPLTKSVQGDDNVGGPIQHTYDAGGKPGRIIIAGSVKNGGVAPTPVANTTSDGARGLNSFSSGGIGHETADDTGSRAVGFSEVWLVGRASVQFVEDDVDITPDPWGMGLGFHAGALTPQADLAIPAARMRGLGLGFRAGQMDARAPRQVLLTGNDLETPEMTEGGTEGQVLTQHTARKPTWEDAGGGSGDVATDAIWDAKGDLAVGTGTDTAIKRSVGSDGHVLTADSAETDGVKWAAPAAAPGEGTSFPGSPSTDERYYRTDHGLWFRYDGTRWSSEQLFRQPMPTNAVPSYSTQSNPSRLAFDDGSDIYLVAWHLTARIGTTNDGSNNWEIALLTQPDGTTRDSMVTSGWSPDTFTRYDAALDTVLDTDAAGDTTRLIQTRVKYNAGTPGDMNMFSSTLDYRIIAS